MNGILPKIKQRLRWKRYSLQFALGMGRPLLKNRPGKRLLMYHGIDPSGRTDLNSRFTSIRSFDHHLNWLKRNCNLVSIEEYFQGRQSHDRLTVALTFDDGYLNNIRHALPLLEKYQVPATFFVTATPSTEFSVLWCDLFDLLRFLKPEALRQWALENAHPADFRQLHGVIRSGGLTVASRFLTDCIPLAGFMQDPAWDDHWKLMQASDIQKAAQNPLINIGNHSTLHPDLSRMPLQDALKECRKSKAWLEECTQQEVRDFAFPFGNYTGDLAQGLHTLGHTRMACIAFSHGPQPLGAEERFGMNPHIPDDVQLVEMLRGSYY